MSQIFIQLYLDEDVDILVAKLIQARGFQISTARDAKQLQKTDSEQLSYATNNHLVLVTHNRVDFEALVNNYFAQGKTYYGVIFATRNSPQEIVRRLLIIINHVTADEMINQVRYI